MSFIRNKASLLGAIITLMTAFSVNATAQTHAAIYSFTGKPAVAATVVETRETTVKQESSQTAEATNPNSGERPSELPAVEPVAKVSAPEKTAVVSLDKGNKNPFAEFAAAPTAAAKSATFPVTKAPRSPQAVDADKWQFQVTPYFWLVGLHGTAGVGNRTAGVDMNFGDVFDALNFFAMGTFEARKGRFFALTDVEYSSVSDENATPGPFFSTVDAGFKLFIFDQEVGYRLYESDNGASVDVLGGIRVWRLKTDFEFGAGILPAVRIEGSRTWVDGVGGLRGKAPLSEKVFVTGKFDLGGGGSQFTWQAFGGLGYNIKPNIARIGGYRVLDVDYNKDNFVYDMNQRGPIFGLGFRF